MNRWKLRRTERLQKEDTVNIDYTGYMDGEEFEGGSATGDDFADWFRLFYQRF